MKPTICKVCQGPMKAVRKFLVFGRRGIYECVFCHHRVLIEDRTEGRGSRLLPHFAALLPALAAKVAVALCSILVSATYLYLMLSVTFFHLATRA